MSAGDVCLLLLRSSPRFVVRVLTGLRLRGAMRIGSRL